MAAVRGRASHTLGVVTFSLIAVLLRKEALQLLLPVHVGIFLDMCKLYRLSRRLRITP